MQYKFLESKEKYDGSQLVSLRSYLQYKLLGDSIVAWVGPCNVELDHMVDGEDLLESAKICGDLMVHFIVELFDSQLFAAVGIQRLLAAIIKDELSSSKQLTAPGLTRDGDDIFLKDRKLSISIATQSPLSSLIHFAVNVTNAGTPVKTLSLEDLAVEPKPFAEAVMQKFCSEVESIRQATQKVRWVK